jgi:hypothetical protein
MTALMFDGGLLKASLRFSRLEPHTKSVIGSRLDRASRILLPIHHSQTMM